MSKEGLLAGAVICFVFSVIFIVVIIGLILRWKKRKGGSKEKYMSTEDAPMVQNGGSSYHGIMPQVTEPKKKPPSRPDVVPKPEILSSKMEHGTEDYYNLDAVAKSSSKAIKIKDLPSIVKQHKKQEKPFNDEFEKLVKDKDPNIGWKYSEKTELKNLNRFKNIIPYDHTRVKLKQIDGDPLSDYVNASFISGYRGEKAFIACHGPVERTMPGFWRMVWEYNVPTIVMVTNFTEYSTMKMNCEQYWASEVNKSQKYGPINVTFTSENIYADYVIRTFSIKHENEKGVKQITHYHYTAWPDHGVPENISTLLKLRRMTKQRKGTTDPVLVHCRAGIGRTGTFIAIDYLLDEAEATGAVDVLKCVQKMRTQRINMVQTQVQYAFLYDVLRLYALLGKTSEPATEFPHYFAKIKKDNSLDKQFKALEELKVEYSKSDLKEATENKDKNRDMNILPSSKNRVFFVMMEDGSNPYFNGVSVRGYRHETGYIATQVPLPKTIHLFWKLVHEKKLKSIVCVQDIDEIQWLPENEPLVLGNITVKVQKRTQEEYFTTVDVTVDVESAQGTLYANTPGGDSTVDKSPVPVRVFYLPEWTSQSLAERQKATLIELTEKVNKWQNKEDKPVLTMCKNGATECGLYICTSFAIDMAYHEQEVDIAQVIKQARVTRPQFIPNVEQYRYIHEVMLEYIDTMHTYSNFKA